MTREEAIKLLEYISIAYTPTDAYGDYDDPQPYEEALDMAIEALKTIDNCDQCEWCCPSDGTPTIRVVRCKDCYYWYEKMNKCDRCPSISGNWGADDFCSWGERKAEEQAEPKWSCTANFIVEQLDHLKKMTDEEKWEFFKRFFEMEGDDSE